MRRLILATACTFGSALFAVACGDTFDEYGCGTRTSGAIVHDYPVGSEPDRPCDTVCGRSGSGGRVVACAKLEVDAGADTEASIDVGRRASIPSRDLLYYCETEDAPGQCHRD